MNTRLYLFIAFRIIFLFSIAIASTFLPEQLRDFFGDKLHVCFNKYCSHGMVDELYDWGSRHYWFFWMMFLLFMLSLVDAITGVVRSIEKYYPNFF